jgi:hypothetical protein
MKRTSGRIVIPTNPQEMLQLASKVFQKHLADGESSPLSNLDGIDLSIVGPNIERAMELHNQAEILKSQMEQAYRERDLLLPAIDGAVKASRTLLKALNQQNPKRLADWGFQVDDSVPTTPTSTPAG